MSGKRRHKRFIKRLEAEFSSEGSSFRGTSSNLSESGLFLRTKKPLPPYTLVDVRIQLPDNTVTRIIGRVRWALKSVHSGARSGMGIEIVENDLNYVNFLNTFLPSEEQILYKEPKKAVQEPPAAKIGSAGHRGSAPVSKRGSGQASPRGSAPAHRPKGSPEATRQSDQEMDDKEIDSLIFSLFPKRESKQGE